MKKSIFIIGTLSCFLFFSCENQNNNAAEESVENTTQDTTGHNEHHDDMDHHGHESEALALNDGEKWEVNEEMRPHVAAEEEMVDSYVASGSTDYKKLAEQLVKENANLVNSCTMKGESHEELHKWLHPHMEILDELGNAESSEQAEEVISKLKESFETFHSCFQ